MFQKGETLLGYRAAPEIMLTEGLATLQRPASYSRPHHVPAEGIFQLVPAEHLGAFVARVLTRGRLVPFELEIHDERQVIRGRRVDDACSLDTHSLPSAVEDVIDALGRFVGRVS